jgi:tubulin polyglutamylase TTLL11
MLLEGLKFDFRIYVVVASLDPLEVYVCRDGLARFCTVPYQFPTTKNIHESFMHLTNYSLNKRSAGYLHTESDMDGSKRTVSSVLRSLRDRGHDVERIWSQVEMLVVKTMIAIAPELKVEYKAQLSRGDPSCFQVSISTPRTDESISLFLCSLQILGFDILLTDTGQPMLLEVNASPSLRIDFEQEVAAGIYECVPSPVDEEIKRPLVLDTLILAAPRHKPLRKR